MEDLKSRVVARWSLHGFKALVTGGTAGIGKAIVEEVGALGASVYTCGRSSSKLAECLKGWKEAGLDVAGSTCDVSSASQRIELIKSVSAHFGGHLDILVNNVGIAEGRPFMELNEDEYKSIFSTNLDSGYHLSLLAHPMLKVSGKASIIFISSIAGFGPVALLPSTLYCMTKGALHQLTKSLAFEWAKDKIRVNCVAPGQIARDMHIEGMDDFFDKNHFLRNVPLGRAGLPQEIGAPVAFLCMPCASYCTGEVFVIDGGTMVNGMLKTEAQLLIKKLDSTTKHKCPCMKSHLENLKQ